MKTYSEYKLELESLIKKMNESEDFEVISKTYIEASAIIQILEDKLSSEEKLVVKNIKKSKTPSE
ncbi:MAG: hypothetical protein ACRCS8_02420 [Brevinema sp.]